MRMQRYNKKCKEKRDLGKKNAFRVFFVNLHAKERNDKGGNAGLCDKVCESPDVWTIQENVYG